MTRYSRMGYPTKLQCIQRQNSQQFYINFPLPMAIGIYTCGEGFCTAGLNN
jgi:hypothetical protein